jgi:DNA/RNA endonuclease YhcR with UshA esterase domain
MSTNTNNLWYVIIGALIVLAIFLGINAHVNDSVNSVFEPSKETIEINNFDKNEIKAECFVFTNFKTENGVLTANIENKCYNDKTYTFEFTIFKNKEESVKLPNLTIAITGENKIENKVLGSIQGIESIYDLKIKSI